MRIIFVLAFTTWWSKLAAGQLTQNASDGNIRQDRVLFKGFTGFRLNDDTHRMVYFHDLTIAVIEITDNETLLNCEFIEVFTDLQREQVLRDLNHAIGSPVKLVFDDIIKLMAQCEELNPKEISIAIDARNPTEKITTNEMATQSPVLSGILPGTKWCGSGDIAKNYYDLGSDWIMDRCCRKHDLCPVKVAPNGFRYNLTNKSPYTMSHCLCDDELAKCLHRANKRAADFMGNIYFNILGVQCIADGNSGKYYRSARPY